MRSAVFAWVVTCLLIMTNLQVTKPGAPLPQAHDGQAGVIAMRAGAVYGTARPPVRCPSTSRQTPLLCTVDIGGANIIAVDELTNRVFVNCNSCGRNSSSVIDVLDATSGALLHVVPVGPQSQAVAVDAPAGLVFVANQLGHSISTLDARTGTVLRTTHIRGDPVTLAVDTRAGRIVALDGNDNNVTVLAASTGRLVAALTLRRQALTVAAAERTGRVFVTDATSGSTTILDARTGRVLGTVRGAGGSMVVDERRGRVYTGWGVVLDARSGAPLHLHLARGADLLALDAPRRRLVGTTSVTVDVSDANSGRVLHSVNVDTQPMSTPAIIARTGHALVLLSSTLDKDASPITPGYLLIVDERTGAVVRRINVGIEESFEDFTLVAVDNRINRAFVIENRAVAVFDAARL